MNDQQRVQRTADLVVAISERGVSAFERTIENWPAEFRAIMWDAVAEIASRRADTARRQATKVPA